MVARPRDIGSSSSSPPSFAPPPLQQQPTVPGASFFMLRAQACTGWRTRLIFLSKVPLALALAPAPHVSTAPSMHKRRETVSSPSVLETSTRSRESRSRSRSRSRRGRRTSTWAQRVSHSLNGEKSGRRSVQRRQTRYRLLADPDPQLLARCGGGRRTRRSIASGEEGGTGTPTMGTR